MYVTEIFQQLLFYFFTEDELFPKVCTDEWSEKIKKNMLLKKKKKYKLFVFNFPFLPHSAGNLNPYLTSYMRWTGTAPDLKNTECTWVFAAAAMGQGLVMSLGGVIQSKLGPRLTCLLGSWWMRQGTTRNLSTEMIGNPVDEARNN